MGVCQYCDGLGTVSCCGGGVEVTHSYSPCPLCHGTGRRICPQCNGTGEYPLPAYNIVRGETHE